MNLDAGSSRQITHPSNAFRTNQRNRQNRASRANSQIANARMSAA
jgi:hypothetical protein